jgi:DNA polymerase-3 subunit delta'
VLTTSVPKRLLPTILSRCQQLRFAPLEPEWMQPRLQALYEETPAKTRLAAVLSQGSMHIAQRYLTGDLDEVRDRVFAALAAAAAGEPLDLLDLAANLAQERKKKRYIVPLFLQLLAAAARAGLLLREGLAATEPAGTAAGRAAAPAAGRALVNADRQAELTKLAQVLDTPRLRGILHDAEVAERQIAGQALAEHSLTSLFLGMAAAGDAAGGTTRDAAAPARARREGRR